MVLACIVVQEHESIGGELHRFVVVSRESRLRRVVVPVAGESWLPTTPLHGMSLALDKGPSRIPEVRAVPLESRAVVFRAAGTPDSDLVGIEISVGYVCVCGRCCGAVVAPCIIGFVSVGFSSQAWLKYRKRGALREVGDVGGCIARRGLSRVVLP